MIVSKGGQFGTIGGGHLEFVATKTAREMLSGNEGSRVDRFSLGASLGQCCGGIVELEFKRYEASDLPAVASALAERVPVDETRLWLFGAGHVARSLVNVIAPLPFAIQWIDSRDAIFPPRLPANVHPLHSPQPADEVRAMAAGDWALVMTHSHEEDFEICRALLENGRFGWAGVIGSAPKAKRFRQRLAQRGFTSAQIQRLVIPIGIAGIGSKEPAAIAVAVAAQLLQLREAHVEAVAPAARES